MDVHFYLQVISMYVISMKMLLSMLMNFESRLLAVTHFLLLLKLSVVVAVVVAVAVEAELRFADLVLQAPKVSKQDRMEKTGWWRGRLAGLW